MITRSSGSCSPRRPSNRAADRIGGGAQPPPEAAPPTLADAGMLRHDHRADCPRRRAVPAGRGGHRGGRVLTRPPPPQQRASFGRPFLSVNDLACSRTRKPQEDERELDAATTRSAINAAAKRVMLAKPELRRLKRRRHLPDHAMRLGALRPSAGAGAIGIARRDRRSLTWCGDLPLAGPFHRAPMQQSEWPGASHCDRMPQLPDHSRRAG